MAGVSLTLPLLEAMGKDVAAKTPRRFCAMYTANGMSLPNPKHGIDDWSWFPKTEGRAFEFGKSTEPLKAFREKLSFLGGLHLPTLIAGGSNIGLKHGTDWRGKGARMSNVFLSFLRSMQIEEGTFSDSTGTLSNSIFVSV